MVEVLEAGHVEQPLAQPPRLPAITFQAARAMYAHAASTTTIATTFCQNASMGRIAAEPATGARATTAADGVLLTYCTRGGYPCERATMRRPAWTA